MIRKRFDLVAGLLMVLISALISGCSFTNILNDPTPTPTHTITVTPTATLTPTPSSTPSPQPTSTVTPVPIPTNISIGETGLSLGFLKPVENAGFAVRQVIGYGADDQVEKGVAMISSDGLIFVGFEAFDFDPSYDSIEEMNAAFLEGFSSELDFSFESSEPYPIIIDGQQALAYDLSSDTYRLKGQSFVLNTDNGLFVYGFGFGLSPTYSSTWDKEGRAVFTALLDTFELIPVTSGKCNISADPTYGYTTDNPVKISGSSTNKYIRETRYLDRKSVV